MALALILSACNSPGSIFAPDHKSGMGGQASGANPVVGNWEGVILISEMDDLQNWTTDWTFRADQSCRFRQSVESLIEGVTRVKLRDCTWRTSDRTLTVTYTDFGAVQAMDYSFAALDPNRLVLEGLEYHRVP